MSLKKHEFVDVDQSFSGDFSKKINVTIYALAVTLRHFINPLRDHYLSLQYAVIYTRKAFFIIIE